MVRALSRTACPGLANWSLRSVCSSPTRPPEAKWRRAPRASSAPGGAGGQAGEGRTPGNAANSHFGLGLGGCRPSRACWSPQPPRPGGPPSGLAAEPLHPRHPAAFGCRIAVSADRGPEKRGRTWMEEAQGPYKDGFSTTWAPFGFPKVPGGRATPGGYNLAAARVSLAPQGSPLFASSCRTPRE